MPNRKERIGPRCGSTNCDLDRDRDGTGLLLDWCANGGAAHGPRATLVAMTQGPDASPDPGQGAGSGRRGWTPWRVVTPLVVLVSGALFAVSALNSGGTDLRPGRYTDLSALVRNESRTYDGLRDRVARLTDEVAALTASV